MVGSFEVSVCVYVWSKWEARVTCFLALEKQPSWQCVGGESPGPGLPAWGLSLALSWGRLLSLTGCGPGLHTAILTWCLLFDIRGKFYPLLYSSNINEVGKKVISFFGWFKKLSTFSLVMNCIKSKNNYSFSFVKSVRSHAPVVAPVKTHQHDISNVPKKILERSSSWQHHVCHRRPAAVQIFPWS